MPFLKKAPACQSETGLTLDGCHERPEAETRPRSPLKCVVKKPRAGIIKREDHTRTAQRKAYQASVSGKMARDMSLWKCCNPDTSGGKWRRSCRDRRDRAFPFTRHALILSRGH
jgi:hypothetical protein